MPSTRARSSPPTCSTTAAGSSAEWSAAGALAVEMEAATLFALAAARGVQAAALLVVSDLILPTRVRIGQDELRGAERRMGEAALRALLAEGAAVQP